ncbi:hypothetical protein BB559_007074 [Furculomyces boomerangus]|uniref:Uncharacterized protein n=1 Tax=Furculomyces boomerangus TaxID=61424 RepID=A0A2T9XZ15_9FUNG|nr:hypothetical protein BB559_007074 [Furculomyces boomerangus]
MENPVQVGRVGTGITKVNIGAPKLISTKLKNDKNAGDEPVVFLTDLMVANFEPEKYLKKNLEFVEEPKIREFRVSLENTKKAVAQNLQKNVYRNYKEFVFVTKEISQMEDEATLFKEMLGKLDTICDGLYNNELEVAGMTEDEKKAARALHRRTIRMTVNDQQGVFAAQMTKLWNSVEGSQRMLPYSPNRHIATNPSYYTERFVVGGGS